MSDSRLNKFFPPFNSKTFIRHYLPLGGAVSHSIFAIHTLNPHLVPHYFPSCDLAICNALLFNAHFGVGVYAYYRRHMKKLSKNSRVLYSVYVAVLFNFGSVLIWAVTKTILPKNAYVRAAFGVLTSLCILMVGKEYFGYLDETSSAEVASIE